MWMETEANTAREAAHSLIDTSMNVFHGTNYFRCNFRATLPMHDGVTLVPVQSQCDNYYNCCRIE